MVHKFDAARSGIALAAMKVLAAAVTRYNQIKAARR